MIINKDELFTIINSYALSGVSNIDIFYPFYDTKLFTIELEDRKIESIIKRDELDRIKKKQAKSEFLKRELPDHHDLLDVFLSSGILNFENQEEIKENFELLRRAVSDRTIYVKPVFIGIDTNIAYYRVVSRRFMNHFKYVLSSIVVEEVDLRIHDKYSSRSIWEFEHLPYKSIVNEFANASSKDARKAKNAMNEIYYISNVLDAFRIEGVTTTKDKEVRDREIVRQYRSFSDEINVDVVLLTGDKDMVFHAQAEQLSSIYFKLPHFLNREYDDIDLKLVPNLIYDLALVFGAVKVKDTIVLGEWRGKSSDDYFKENLKIYNPTSELIKDLKICRGVLHEFQRDAR